MIGVILNHRYQIQELIGTGGMAQVYRAVNLANHRPVAIKMLKEEYRDSPEFLRRFEREAKTVLHLTQENIVHAYGVGEYNGIPFIVLEYVEGKTLKSILQDKGALSQKTAVSYCVQILNALAAAHDAGIIHRDVKPQNIIITPSGKVKLTDFGIARDAQATTVTFAGSTVLGSAHYLSPEQAQGKPVSEESDLYSAGVVLYEMLTGTVPFTADTTVSVALKHINENPVPAIERNPEVFPSVNYVVMRSLSKDPSSRYRTAERMKRALLTAMKKRDYIPADSSQDLLADDSDSGDAQVASIHTIPLVAKIAIIVGLFIVAFTGMFFGIRYIFAASAEAANVVPSLVGKKLETAQNRAEDYGFTVDIKEYESSSDPAGTVLTQSPDAGKHAKPGSAITITVSAGPEVPTVPDLIGLTYEEALSELENAGFRMGTVSYQVSDTAIGYVCSQSIPAGTEFPEGEEVSISISATATSTFKMPSVILFPLSEAVKLLDSTDNVKIRIMYDTTADKSLGGTVILQQPIAGEDVQTGRTVTLTVGGSQPSGYSADIAFNVDITESGTPVIGAIEDAISGVLVERVLYSNILEPGEKIPVSFTATVSISGRYEVILYINGVEVKRQEVNFTDEAAQE